MLSDESMNQLYDGGNGEVLSLVMRWMESDVEHLQNSAALAIGNLARSGNCDSLYFIVDNDLNFYFINVSF